VSEVIDIFEFLGLMAEGFPDDVLVGVCLPEPGLLELVWRWGPIGQMQVVKKFVDCKQFRSSDAPVIQFARQEALAEFHKARDGDETNTRRG